MSALVTCSTISSVTLHKARLPSLDPDTRNWSSSQVWSKIQSLCAFSPTQMGSRVGNLDKEMSEPP